MKGCFTFPRAPELEPIHRTWVNVTLWPAVFFFFFFLGVRGNHFAEDSDGVI